MSTFESQTRKRKNNVEKIAHAIQVMRDFDPHSEEYKIALARYQVAYNWLTNVAKIKPAELFRLAGYNLNDFGGQS